eukprot:scaffold23126_cov241-Isochrysis_galbana.AAC.2
MRRCVQAKVAATHHLPPSPLVLIPASGRRQQSSSKRPGLDRAREWAVSQRTGPGRGPRRCLICLFAYLPSFDMRHERGCSMLYLSSRDVNPPAQLSIGKRQASWKREKGAANAMRIRSRASPLTGYKDSSRLRSEAESREGAAVVYWPLFRAPVLVAAPAAMPLPPAPAVEEMALHAWRRSAVMNTEHAAAPTVAEHDPDAEAQAHALQRVEPGGGNSAWRARVGIGRWPPRWPPARLLRRWAHKPLLRGAGWRLPPGASRRADCEVREARTRRRLGAARQPVRQGLHLAGWRRSSAA